MRIKYLGDGIMRLIRYLILLMLRRIWLIGRGRYMGNDFVWIWLRFRYFMMFLALIYYHFFDSINMIYNPVDQQKIILYALLKNHALSFPILHSFKIVFCFPSFTCFSLQKFEFLNFLPLLSMPPFSLLIEFYWPSRSSISTWEFFLDLFSIFASDSLLLIRLVRSTSGVVFSVFWIQKTLGFWH